MNGGGGGLFLRSGGRCLFPVDRIFIVRPAVLFERGLLTGVEFGWGKGVADRCNLVGCLSEERPVLRETGVCVTVADRSAARRKIASLTTCVKAFGTKGRSASQPDMICRGPNAVVPVRG